METLTQTPQSSPDLSYITVCVYPPPSVSSSVFYCLITPRWLAPCDRVALLLANLATKDVACLSHMHGLWGLAPPVFAHVTPCLLSGTSSFAMVYNLLTMASLLQPLEYHEHSETVAPEWAD